jgi:RNA polymerase sigma-70 factor (ECF subfamily)
MHVVTLDTADRVGPGLDFEQYRPALTGYCYRMLGSAFEADDAVQETMLRAWRNVDSLEGPEALKSWLYRIATNVCLDMLDGRKRRARPVDLGPAGTSAMEAGELTTAPEATWLEPIPSAAVLGAEADPADVIAARETLRLAFVAALQHLPPRQRAVLILCEVLRWKASEAAELLETSTASVNSALQRARATLDASEITANDPAPVLDDERSALLERYVTAFEAFDIESMVELLHEDAVLSMPPYELWLRGPEEIEGWWRGLGNGCAGSVLVPTMANGIPAFGQYRPSGPGGSFEPWALQVVDFSEGRLVAHTAFLDTERLFPLFGLGETPEPALAQ